MGPTFSQETLFSYFRLGLLEGYDYCVFKFGNI